MRLTDKEREAINDLPSWPEDIGTGSYRIAMDVLDRLLAREAEHETPVTPEWLDGAEARRLGFERTGDDGHWFLSSSSSHRVAVERGCAVLSVYEREDMEGLLFRNPTVAQVRAAVFLATGRR